jgi:arylsulfatase A-like enzyme
MRRLALLCSLVAAPTYAEPEKPKLVVLVVFDQMRGDYPERWKSLFVEDGFVRLENDGAWYVNCHYPYAVTTTGPGHASMLTGCCADRHGIVNNTWYDAKAAATLNCANSTRYQRVPPAPKTVPEPEPEESKTEPKTEPTEPKTEATPPKPKAQGAPDRILVQTLSDVLKAASPKSKVIGLSFKDRSAVLPTGKKADGVFWLDSTDGLIVTSTYYRETLPPWVTKFNQARLADSWFDRPWTHLLGDLDYAKYSGPDDVQGEGKGSKQGVVFPHPMNAGLKKFGKGYYDALFNSPYGNDFLFDLVKTAVGAEKLGEDETPDLLVVSFSSNDAIGHTWGPDSQEVLDCTLRSDRMLARFLKFLDEKVGKDKYLLALTADHGICPLPEVSAAQGKDAKRISGTKLVAAIEEHLTQTYGKLDTEVEGKEPKKTKPKWVESTAFPWVYLNQRVIEKKGLKTPDVAKTMAEFLKTQDGIARAYTRADLEGYANSDEFLVKMRRSYYAPRCGDVGIIVKPYCLINEATATGTTHGSPYPYDTHVPLMVFGTGVKPGVRKDEAVPQMIAAIFAKALGVDPPSAAQYGVPKELFGREK